MSHTLSFKALEFDIDLSLRGDITILTGDTASGKSFLYYLLTRSNADNIMCINYESVILKSNYKAILNEIKSSTNKIIVIDQADDIQQLDDSIMYAINTDTSNNKFIVIGRAAKVGYNISNIAEVKVENQKVKLEYIAPEPLKPVGRRVQ